MLQGKKIILGVCGSIAAYKAALLTRLFIKHGAEVKVITTTSALDFITPLTLATLSKNPVLTSFQQNDTGEWHNHVELGLWADVMVVAPATANTLAKMANGFCDNLLLATYLSARCPVFISPAMDLDMYAHPATLLNIEKLKSFGNQVIDAEHGELASGLVGTGRMAEPEHIVDGLIEFFNNKNDFKGKKILITAGPTHEAIDPVRFIGNNSSGKMGFALADEIAERGGEVCLVSGPTSQKPTNNHIKLRRVKSAEEMHDICVTEFVDADVAILSAAVADYKPKIQFDQKIKKKTDDLNIELIKTHDIAAELGKIKKNNQFIVGFALETENESEHAQEKLKKKNFDFIVLNSLNNKGAGFGHDTNKITIIRDNNSKEFELKTKKEVAKDIANEILNDIQF
ncbi:MAG: bifunctional phosphopantothenoylcysteine decarboxylase/phosphopantothenate--cysteine ligase CoaBC [Cyclobacteriaceae bacterium]|nr:bifunctional phosphopantothenoylcysteine decarboxylase/phosphopantothenate--cysteine ligase CoaBC [Cyclobacteriaceae bacterium]